MESTPPAAPLLSVRTDAVVSVLVAIFAIALLSPLGDVAVTAMASSADSVRYRFQVVGLFYAAVPQVATLLALVAAVAILTGRRVVLRTTAIAAMVLGLVVLILSPIFGLDMLESRRTVAQTAVKGFTLAAVKTAGLAVLLAVLAVWSGWLGFKASEGAKGNEPRTKGEGLVVGQE
jgi:hypothetical protein